MIMAHFVLIDAGNVASLSLKLNSGQESPSSPINRFEQNERAYQDFFIISLNTGKIEFTS